MNTKEGDIFITKLERDFYGAFKIIKKGKSFFSEIDGDLLMIAVLNYIDIFKTLFLFCFLTSCFSQKNLKQKTL